MYYTEKIPKVFKHITPINKDRNIMNLNIILKNLTVSMHNYSFIKLILNSENSFKRLF